MIKFYPKKLVIGRQSRGFTRKEFSVLTMIPLQTIRKIEKGVELPTRAMIRTFSKHLNVPINFFHKTYWDRQQERKKIEGTMFMCGSFGCRVVKRKH